MKKITAGWIAMVVVLASAGSLVAHHSLAQYDTSTAVRVKGRIARVELVNPHTIVYVDQKGADGQIQHWSVAGPGVTQLTRIGFDKETLKVGDVIEACGYVKKEVSEPKSTGGLLDAEILVMPGGQTQKWSDYGHHLCLGADYHDFHK